MKVRDVMSMAIVEVPAHATCQGAAQLMRQWGVGMLLVTKEGRELEGIITDRDLVTRCLATADEPAQLQVRDYMEQRPTTVEADCDLERALEVMHKTHHRRLPVTEGGKKVVGLLSIDDVALDVKHYTDAFLSVAGQYSRRSRLLETADRRRRGP
ncbi:MAG: CBS domain-containing protein [Dehalococcoidia bacterium]